MVIMFLYDKATIHLFINKFHSSWADTFFRIVTNLGDGIFVVIISILLIIWKLRFTIYSLSVYILSGFFVQLFKRFLWPNAIRPVSFFDENVLHLVDNIHLHYQHSFPSGHTASAFGLFVLLILLIKNKTLQWVFFILAFITGYSRIYLSQHFLIDVIGGSIIGVTCTLVLYKLFVNLKPGWLDFSLIRKKDEN